MTIGLARILGRALCALTLMSAAWLPAWAESRVALVVGNGAYKHATPLANPVNDARAMAKALEAVGFEVFLGLDLDKRGLDEKTRAFSRALSRADAVIFYYAGHGLQVAGRNYLVPIDAQLQSERDLDFEALPLEIVLKQMELEREKKTSIVFLDACRDNPLARNLVRSMGTRSAAVGKGLAQIQSGVGTFISYATQPGNVALDGGGQNSPYTAALVRSLQTPGRSLTGVMIDVRKHVIAETKGAQVPWDHSSLTGEFFFLPASVPAGSTVGAPATSALNERVRKLETELSKRPSPEQAQKIARIEQLRERIRRLKEENQAEQQKIFEVYRTHGRSSDPSARQTVNREVGRLQRTMVARNRERQKAEDEIKKLEGELGPVAKSADTKH